MTPHILVPQFCPRSSCRFYDPRRCASARWYIRYGTFSTRCRGVIQRFRCRSCGKTCSTQTFSLHYWTHSTIDYVLLRSSICSASGLCQYGRSINKSFRVVQNRLRHFARNCLALLDAASSQLTLESSLVLDGFESFTRSQYFPNNITMLLGGNSEYAHGAFLTVLRRKGRMTDTQKRVRAMIDRHWRPLPNAIKFDTRSLLSDYASQISACASAATPVRLWTDRHRSYPPAIRSIPKLLTLLRGQSFRHLTVSSRAARTTANPLFAANYIDRQLRKDLGEHARESAKHGREANCQMERIAVYLAVHNLLAPHRVRDGVDLHTDPTRAQVAGIRIDKLQSMLDRLHTHRFLWGHCRNQFEWQRRIWQHQYRNPPAVDRKTGAKRATTMGIPAERMARHFLA